MLIVASYSPQLTVGGVSLVLLELGAVSGTGGGSLCGSFVFLQALANCKVVFVGLFAFALVLGKSGGARASGGSL